MANWDSDGDDDVVQETPEYSPKSEFSKARVVEQAIVSCRESRAKEMKAGYFNSFLDKSGMLQKQWIPDARDTFFSSVMALRCLLNPEINRDKRYQRHEEEIYKTFEQLTEKYGYEEKFLTEKEGKLIYEKTGAKIIPPVDAVVIIQGYDGRQGKVIGQEVKGGWNDKLNYYKDELIQVYDALFAELNDLIDRLNYFKTQASF